MTLISKIIVRALFSATIIVIIVSGLVSVGPSVYEAFQAFMAVFAIISADVLIEKYLSRERDET